MDGRSTRRLRIAVLILALPVLYAVLVGLASGVTALVDVLLGWGPPSTSTLWATPLVGVGGGIGLLIRARRTGGGPPCAVRAAGQRGWRTGYVSAEPGAVVVREEETGRLLPTAGSPERLPLDAPLPASGAAAPDLSWLLGRSATVVRIESAGRPIDLAVQRRTLERLRRRTVRAEARLPA